MKKLFTLVFASCFCLMTGNLMAQSLTVSTTSINLGSVQVGSSATGTFTVSGSSLKGDVSISSNNAQLTVSPTSIAQATAQAGAQTVTLTLSPNTSGNGSATVTVSSKRATSKTVTVSWTATVPPTLTVSSNYVNFGNVSVDATATRTFTVSGVSLTGNVTLSSNNAQLTVSPSSITKANAEAGNQTVTMTLTPTAATIGTAKVTVASQDATSKTVSVSWNSAGSNLPAGVVELPNTLDKSNSSGASAGMTYYNSTYFELGGDAYAEWTVYLSHPGNYFVSEQGYYHWGHNYLLELRDGNTVKSSYTTATTYDSGELTISQGTKWNLSSVPAGQYTLRVKCNLSGGDPCLKSLTLDYEGEIIPTFPVPDPDPNGAHVTYTADNSTIFQNPERGFYYHFEKHLTTSDPYCIKNSTTELNSHISDKGSLVLLVYYLDEYKSTTIPQTILNAFDEDMATLRSKGVKCIIRYAYTDSDEGEIGHDAPLSIVQQHINQLKPKWQANADVIFCFQVGWVGSWGEWYYSEYFGNKTSHMNADRISVVDAMLDAVPEDRCILIRTPLFKTEYIGNTTPLDYMEAYTGTPKSRIGHHNDAYLYGGEDQGTYSDTAVQKPYLARETFYVPAGGETNETNATNAQTKASYNNTIAETSRLHYTFINQGYAPAMTNQWRSNGAYDALRKWLGYRFQLVDGTFTQQAAPGGAMSVYMNIKNTGYAPLYNERPVFIVLKNNSNTYQIQMSADPRRWRPNGETTTVSEILTLPANIAVGTYNLYLYMPDAYQSLRSNSKYSVRFANGNNMWDDNTGMNNLNASITISNNVSTPTLSVSPTTVSFGDVMMATTDTRTISVSGVNLLGNITVSSNNAALTVSPATITPAEASSGATVTLSVHPTATGSGSAVVTLASDGAPSQTVNVTWNGTAVSGAVELPATLNKANVSTVSNDMTYYATDPDYFDFGPEDNANTERWAKWSVYLSYPSEYTISAIVTAPSSGTGHEWSLRLMNAGGDTIASYNTLRTWTIGEVNYSAKWDLSNVPAGVYTLLVRNAFPYAQPKLKSLTLDCEALLTSHTITWNATANGGTCTTATSEIAIGDPLGTLPTATKAGYVCIGWFTSADGSEMVKSTTIPTSNATYYAQFLPIPQLSGTAVDLPNTLNKANHATVSENMAWWGTNNDYFDIGPDDDPNIYSWAAWRVNLVYPTTYTVTEETNCSNGHQYILQLFNGNTLVSEYITEQKSATVGDQAYEQATPWDLSSVPAGNYMLTVRSIYSYSQPKLKRITLACDVPVSTYTVTWDAATNGGSCATVTTNVTAGDAVGTLPSATKTGHTLVGWFTAASGGTQITAATIPTGDVTYYAQFTPILYTITWKDGNGSTLKMEQVAYGTTPSYTGTTPTKTATAQYTYTFNNTWSPTITAVTGDATYTAQFNSTLRSYTITWKDGDGNTLKTEQVNYGATPSYTGSTPTKTATAQYTYTFNNTWSPTISAVTGNATYTAQFSSTLRSYTISFNANGHGTAPSSQSVAFGAKVTDPGNLSATGWTFGGWYKEAACTNAWNFNTMTVSGEQTLYAKWTATSYSITCNLDGGSLAVANPTSYTIESNAITLNNPTKTGYDFAGWTGSNGSTPQKTVIIAAGSTGNKTYTANWTAQVYNIIYRDQNDADFSGEHGNNYPTSHTYGVATSLVSPTKTGYTFNGWFTTSACTGNAVSSLGATAYTGNITLYAKWTIKQYLLTVQANNDSYGTVSGGGTYNYNTVHTITATPATGYSFKRWELNGSQVSTEASYSVTIPAEDVTYTAVFEPSTNTNYTVKHWQQNINNNEYTEVTGDRQTLTGTTGGNTAAVAKTYTGFTAQSFNQSVIAANGSTIVNIYYNRNIYTITANGATGGGSYKYGATVTLTATPADNYHFTEWSDHVTTVSRQVTVTDNATYTALSEEDAKTTVYLFPTIWAVDNAKFAAYVFEDGKAAAWSAIMTQTADGKAYTAQVYDYEKIIFVRLNNTATAGSWAEGVKWNQTADLTRSTAYNCYQITGWGDGNSTGKWRNYPFYYVQFADYDNTVLKTDTVDSGNAATAPANPLRTGYTFTGWDKAFNNITEDLVVTAQYTAIEYTIKWMDGNGNELYSEQVAYGETPVYNAAQGGTPTKTATAQYTYTFNNTWSPGIAPVTGNQTYTAQFSSTLRSYTITYLDDNDQEISHETLNYGVMPNPATPAKAATAQYTYTFAGWNPALTTVTGDATYRATFNSTVNKYTITWKDGNGNTLKTEQVAYGATPSYTGATPTKTATAQYTYTFNNTWSPAIAAVTGDATYTAQFNSTVNQYTVTFYDEDGTTVLKSSTLDYGTPITAPANPTKAATAQYTYTFSGWNPALAPDSVVRENASFRATYSAAVNQYTITANASPAAGGSVTGAGTYDYNTSVTLTATAAEHYHFVQWSDGVATQSRSVTVTGDATYTAEFAKDRFAITVLAQDNHGTTSGSGTYDYGESIQISATGNTGYTFTQWSDGNTDNPRTVTVTSAATYTAQFSAVAYTITKNVTGQGSIEGPDGGNINDVVTLTAVPAYGWKFDKWDNNSTDVTRQLTITGNMSVTATFVRKQFSVTTSVNNEQMGSVTAGGSYDYETSISLTATPATHYHFVQWSNGATTNPLVFTLTKDTVLEAQFAIDTYTLTIGTNDATMGSVSGAGTYDYGETAHLEATPAEGYHFVGWEPSTLGTNSTVNVTVDGTITHITAIFAINTYTVRFLVDGAEYDVQTINHGSNATAPADPTKTGYTFTGWDKSLNNITADRDINAQFSINSYTITFKNANGDILTGEGYTGSYEFGTTLHPADPTMARTAQYTFSFREWKPALASVSEAATYTAVYDTTVNQYTVRFNANGHGIAPADQTVDYDAHATKPTMSEVAGYTFAGWYREAECHNAWNFAQDVVKNDVELFAKWDVNQYKLTVKANNDSYGTVSGGGTYNYNTAHTITATPATGYHFVGWKLNDLQVSTDASYSVTIPAEDVTYTAVFEPNEGTAYTVRHLLQNLDNENNYDEIVSDRQTLYGITGAQTNATANTYTGFTALAITQKTIAADNSTVIEIRYNRNIYTITANGATGGGSYKYGATVTLTATPADNYHFTEWSDHVTTVSRQVTVTDNATYTALSEEDAKTTVYLFPTIWAVDNAKFAAYVFEDGKAAAWSAIMTQTADGKAYTAQVYDYEKIIFVRLNNTATAGSWAEGVKWNQTADLTRSTAYNCYQITGWGDGNSTGKWRNYPFYYVQFKDYDNTVLKTDTVDSGNAATAPANPLRTGYTFTGWDKAFNNITEDLVVTAQYTAIEYTIKWMDGNGNELYSEQVAYGEMPVYNAAQGGTPTKTADAQYTYTFNNTWSPAIVTVTGDATYTAQFDKTVNKYTVTWKNEDGTILETDENVPYGEMPHYDGSTPTKAATVQETFTFAEWSPEIETVKGNAVYTATYTSSPRKYTITFLNEDGSQLDSGEYPYGAMPEYNGATPTKAEDEGYTYTFSGWDHAIEAVSGEATYTATFTATPKTFGGVTIASADPAQGTVSADPQKDEYTYGDEVTITATANDGYSFEGWVDENGNVISTEETTTITISGNTTITAQFTANDDIVYIVRHWQQNITDNEYTEVENDRQEMTGTMAQLTTAVANDYLGFIAQTIEQKTIAVKGTVVDIYYDRQLFAVIFVVEGVEEQNSEWKYGAMPEYSGATPTKAEDDNYTYTFSGWTPEITEVTGEATYTAVFTPTEKQPTGIESVVVTGNSISGPEGMRIYDYTGRDVTGLKDKLYMGTFIIVVDGKTRKVMIP